MYVCPIEGHNNLYMYMNYGRRKIRGINRKNTGSCQARVAMGGTSVICPSRLIKGP